MSGVMVLDVLGAPGRVECKECHRPLRDHDSRRRGVGPVCWDKTHPPVVRARAPRRRAVMAAPAPLRAAPADGQLALDLTTEPRKVDA